MIFRGGLFWFKVIKRTIRRVTKEDVGPMHEREGDMSEIDGQD